MKEAYLEVMFRRGRAIGGYYYLPRRPGEKSVRTIRVEPGLVIDFGRSGKAIGIEITTPGEITASLFNRVLRELGLPALKRTDLTPLRGA